MAIPCAFPDQSRMTSILNNPLTLKGSPTVVIKHLQYRNRSSFVLILCSGNLTCRLSVIFQKSALRPLANYNSVVLVSLTIGSIMVCVLALMEVGVGLNYGYNNMYINQMNIMLNNRYWP